MEDRTGIERTLRLFAQNCIMNADPLTAFHQPERFDSDERQLIRTMFRSIGDEPYKGGTPHGLQHVPIEGKKLTRKQAVNVIKQWVANELNRVNFDFVYPDVPKAVRALLWAEKKKFLAQLISHTVKVTLSSAKQDWLTPPYFLDIVRRFGPIALDPCGNALSFVHAWITYLWPQIDGLANSWWVPENTVCFVNPPYGRELALWAAKMAKEYGDKAITRPRGSLIALIPARTGTGYWNDFLWPFADAICFWTGGAKHPSRMCFYGLDGRPADAGATFDAAVVYFGPKRERFQEVFETYGTVQLVN